MSIYELKSRFQNLLRPFCRGLATRGITANQITLAALLLSALQGALLCLFPASRVVLLSLPFVLFLRMALNAIDGMLAREHNMKSPLGAFLNELGDVLSDIFLYLPFALLPGMPAPLIFASVLLAILTEMTGLTALLVGADRRYDGPMGKSDRAFVFGLLAFLLGLGLPAGPWLSPLFILINLLLILTIRNRITKALETAL